MADDDIFKHLSFLNDVIIETARLQIPELFITP
jgi:hypothetical protein